MTLRESKFAALVVPRSFQCADDFAPPPSPSWRLGRPLLWAWPNSKAFLIDISLRLAVSVVSLSACSLLRSRLACASALGLLATSLQACLRLRSRLACAFALNRDTLMLIVAASESSFGGSLLRIVLFLATNLYYWLDSYWLDFTCLLLTIMAISWGSYYTQLVGLSLLLFLYACAGFWIALER